MRKKKFRTKLLSNNKYILRVCFLLTGKVPECFELFCRHKCLIEETSCCIGRQLVMILENFAGLYKDRNSYGFSLYRSAY